MDHDRSLSSLQSLVLDLPPSCIEFCPAHPEHFVVGTYNLQKDEVANPIPSEEDEETEEHSTKQPQSRNGSLVVFHLSGGSLIHVQTVLQPSAILDLHFSHLKASQDVMAVVSSTGTFSLFKLGLGEGSPTPQLTQISTLRPLGDDESTLLLSCAWHPSIPGLIAITTSTFEVRLLHVGSSFGLEEVSSTVVLTHSLEAWTVSFSPFLLDNSTNQTLPDSEKPSSGETVVFPVFSGGDDSKLLYGNCTFYPGRLLEEDIEPPALTRAVRGHTAGVTAILPLKMLLADGSPVVVTGSYDDHIRVYAVGTQLGQQARMLAEENLGGGVWRLKLISLKELTADRTDPAHTVRVLASCMHAGSRLLELVIAPSGDCKVVVLARFEEHKSMNYGSDFQPGTEETDCLRCISTSFYDKLLCLWEDKR